MENDYLSLARSIKDEEIKIKDIEREAKLT